MVRPGRSKPRRVSKKDMPLRKKTAFPLRRGSEPEYAGQGISIIIPIGGKDRTPHLQKVLQNLHGQNYGPCQVLISEYGVLGKQHFKQAYGPTVKYLYTKGGPLFNKSKAMNKAFMAAEHDICLLVDADILLPANYLIEIDRHIRGYEATFLLNRVLHTAVVKSLLHNVTPPICYIRNDNFNGASVAIRKDAFIKIGGMCEEFEGYGYEDLEFWDRLRKMLNLNEDRIFGCLHMNHAHPRGYDRQWAKNQKLWTKLAGQPPKERAQRFRSVLEQYR